jgi:hypothetical protein
MTDTKSEFFDWPYLGMQYLNIIRMSRLGALEVTQPNLIQFNALTNQLSIAGVEPSSALKMLCRVVNAPVHFCLTTKEEKRLFNSFLNDLKEKTTIFDAVTVENKTRDPQRASVFKVNDIASRLLYRVAKDNFDSKEKIASKIISDTKDSKTSPADDEDEEEDDEELEEDAHYKYISYDVQNDREDPYGYLVLLYKFLKLWDSTTFIADHKIRRGDIVKHENSYNHNDGYFGVGSDKLVNLSESNDYGSVPDEFKVITEFPMNYWQQALYSPDKVSLEPHLLDIIAVDYNFKFDFGKDTITAVIGDESVTFSYDFKYSDDIALSIIAVRNPLTPCGITYIIKFHPLVYDAKKSSEFEMKHKITSQQELYKYFMNCDTLQLQEDDDLEGYLEMDIVTNPSWIEQNDRQRKVKEILLDDPFPKVLAGLISEYIA